MADLKSQAQRAPAARQGGTLALASLAAIGIFFWWTHQPSPALEIVEAGKRLAQAGRMEEAVVRWQEAAARDPKCAPAWAELGRYYLSVGDPDSAIAPNHHLVDLDPNSPNALGYLAASISQSQHSEPTYRQALKDLDTKPDDLAALTIAASYLSSRDEQRMQITYLRRLVQLRPKDLFALTSLAKTLVNTHHYDDALPILEQLIALAPNNPAGYDLRGQTLLKGVGTPQALAEAESDFLKALELKSPSLFPHLNLGRVYLRMGKPDQAVEQLQAAAERLPNRPEVFFELAHAYALANQPVKAAEAQARFVALRQNEDREQALTKRLSAYPENFGMHLELARLLIQKGDLEKAKPYLDEALALRPNDPGAQETARRFMAQMREMENHP